MQGLCSGLGIYVSVICGLAYSFYAFSGEIDNSHFVSSGQFESQYISSPMEYRINTQYGVRSPEALTDEDGGWRVLEGPANFIFEERLVWVKFPILNKSTNHEWVVEVDWPKAVFVSIDMFYKPDSSDTYIKIEKTLRNRFYSWSLELENAESGSIIFRADAPERLSLPIRLYRGDRYGIETLYIAVGVSLLISFIIALGLYNLFIGLRTRDGTHLWYSLGQFALGGFFVIYYGLDQKVLSGVPHEYILIGSWILGYLALLGLSFFIVGYLEFKNRNPRLYPIILGLFLCLFITIGFYGHVDSQYVVTAYFIQMGGLLVFFLVVALMRAIKGDRLALYFLLIWISVSGFIAIFNSQMLGILERTLFSNHALLIGFALEALLFSFALGERINILTKENYEAETSAKVKSEFLAQMSHEIRTPMNAIIGMSQLMGLTELAKKQQFYNDLVQSSGESLLCIINDILDFSKIESGKLDLERIPFSLNEVLQGVLGIFYSHVKRTQIPLYCSVQPLVPDELNGDPSRLRQILINLVGNAFKFTSEGFILLSVSVDPLVPGQVKFSVRDSGVGISESAQQKLFSAFSQVDASTSRKYGGTGLGLAISKKLSALMEGEIGLESTVGVGSCFFFTASVLPKREQSDVADGIANRNNQEGYLLRNVEGMFDFSPPAKCIVVWSRPEFCDLLATHFICYNVRVLRCSTRQQLSLLLNEAKPGLLGVIVDEEMLSFEQLQLLGIISSVGCNEEGDEEGSRKGKAQERQFIGEGKVKVKVQPVQDSFKWIILTGDIEDRPIASISHGFEMCRWGTINRFYEKLVVDQETENEQIQTSYQTIRGGLRVLIAEDVLTNQEVIRGFMSELGHEITMVDNGIRAVQDYQRHSEDYDLILMDCSMPEMDGFEATRAIRNFEKIQGTQPTPIVALTAQAFAEHRQQCLNAGMNDHLSKPITLKSLVNTLNRYFSEPGLNSESGFGL